MHPQLIPFLHIGSYSVMLLIGLASGYWMARILARRAGIEPRHIDNLALICAAAGLFGARYFSMLFYMPGATAWSALRVWEGGGLVFYGGLLAGLAAMMIYGVAARLPLRRLADVLAPGAAVGLAAGRVGCFLAGCCWGDVCLPAERVAAISDPAARHQVQTFPVLSQWLAPVAVEFPARTDVFKQHRELGLVPANAARSAPVHPAQLYESAFVLALGFFLWRHHGRRRFAGENALWAGALYGAGRFALEFVRADAHPRLYGMTLSQLISVAVVAGCVAGGLWLLRTGRDQKLAGKPCLAERRPVETC